MSLIRLVVDQDHLDRIRGAKLERQVIGSRNARCGRATPENLLHIGFSIKPIGHLVARHKAALFSAEIGCNGDPLFARDRIIGRRPVQIN